MDLKKTKLSRARWLCLAVMAFFCLAAVAQADRKVSLKLRNASIYELFNAIKKQTGVGFMYSNSAVSSLPKKNYDFSEAPLRTVLDYCLDGSGLTYEVQNNENIIIKRRHSDIIGYVFDKDGNPLPGATIMENSTKKAATSDTDGRFSLPSDGRTGAQLTVSYIGMKPVQVAWKTRLLKIYMEEDSKHIDEVVVTGYQVMSRRESASAITSVKAKDVITPNAMSIDQMLQGKIPGMMVMSQSGEPSSTPTIRIRGNSTINGSKGPVWVVDGVIMSDAVPFTASDINSPDATYLIGNSISGLSPQDIESIDVLKDASATAIYGVKAANGVIVITTKKGRTGRPVVAYDGSITLNTRPTYGDFDMMNSQERVNLSKEIYEARLQYPRVPMQESYEGALQQLLSKNITQEEFGNLVHRYETINTNWFKELFRTTATQNHSVSVNGGTSKVRYYSSLSYNNSPGIAKTSESERLTGLGKLWVRINKSVCAELKLDISHAVNDGYAGALNPFTYAYNTSRAFSPYTDTGEYYFYNKSSLSEPISYNILNELEQTGKSSVTDRFGGVFKLDARLLRGLTYTGTVSYYYTDNRLNTWATDRSYSVASIRGYDYGAYFAGDDKYESSALPFGGTFSNSNTSSRSYTIRNTLNYIEQFNDKHDVNLFAGIEIRSDKYDGYSSYAYGWDPQYGQSFSPVMTDRYLSKVKSGTFNPTITEKVTQVASYIGSASYTYDDRYVFNANMRSDGSNKFGSNPKYRWLPTWSVAGKWIASNEKFMRNLKFIDHLSLRASYGIQGNIQDTATPNLIVEMGSVDDVSGIRKGTIYRLPNPNLRWEKTRSYNVGVDAAFFDRRLTLTFDYYHKRTSDLITDMRVSPVTGRNYLSMNAGKAINKGFEGSISADIIRTQEYNWNLSLNFSHNTNEIRYAYDAGLSDTEMYENMLEGNVAVVGQPLGTIYSFKFEGLSSENGYPLFLAKDGRKVYAGDYSQLVMVPCGSIYPDVSGGFDTRLTIKRNLSVSLGFSYQLGGVKRLPAIYQDAMDAFDPSSNLPRDYVNRWKQSGDELHTVIPALYDRTVSNGFPKDMLALEDETSITDVSMSTMYDYSDIRVANSDFLRLRSIMISYRLPQEWLSRFHVSSMTVRLQGNNLKTWAAKEWKGLDPETAYANMPIMPSYSLGLNITF